MKKSIFLFALLFIAIFSSKEAMAVELDTVWVSDTNGQVLFQHPITKNILVAANGGITELNIQDGTFVRKLPVGGTCIEMSPDGTKILYCADDGVRVFDYNTFEDYLVITTKYWYPKFLGNDKIVFLSGIKANTEIGVYNIQNKDFKFYPFFSEDFTAFATSPDGKYIAYATHETNNLDEKESFLNLIDVETMKKIKQLGSWKSGGHYIVDIQFSSDSKFATYTPGAFQKEFPINIYDLENFNISKSITIWDFQYETCGIIFLDDTYYIIRGMHSFNEQNEVRLCNLRTHEVIYKTNDYMKFIQTAALDSKQKYLFCNTPALKTFCFDLNNIISGIQSINHFNVQFLNKKLIINNNKKPINNISIMTIEGREVYSQNFDRLLNLNNPIEIPLELSSGSYIINLVSDKETYTEKIIIVD